MNYDDYKLMTPPESETEYIDCDFCPKVVEIDNVNTVEVEGELKHACNHCFLEMKEKI